MQMPFKYAIGIDPGLKGAVVLIKEVENKRFEIYCAFRLPFQDNVLAIGTFLELVTYCKKRSMDEFTQIYLEQAVAAKFIFAGATKRMMSADSAYTTGYNFGRLVSALSFKRLAHTIVAPRTWTAELHRGFSKDVVAKQKSSAVFARLCVNPDAAIPERCRVEHDGIVDAALIAWWGLTKNELNTAK